MVDELEKKIADMFSSAFDPNARQLAEKLGASLIGRIFEVGYTQPLFVQSREAAITRAGDLCDSVALTQNFGGVRAYKDVKNGSSTCRIGYDEKGTPVVCLLKGVVGFTSERGFEGYLSVVAAYRLGANGSATHHKPSGNQQHSALS